MKIEPKFTDAQAIAVRVALSYAAESEDGQFVRVVENARRELERAYLAAKGASKT